MAGVSYAVSRVFGSMSRDQFADGALSVNEFQARRSPGASGLGNLLESCLDSVTVPSKLPR